MQQYETTKTLLVVSPMAGLTDAPFHHLALRLGANYAISEMVTSQTQLWQSTKTQLRLKGLTSGRPRIIQIAGASPEVIAEAAVACATLGVDAIEINMGCPAKKVCNVLAGSALLRDPALVQAILTAAVASVKVPIYLKTRLGWDAANQNILEIARLAEECGIQSLTIHGRTRAAMYNGQAEYALIKQVKQAVTIPVFANGDITTPEKAKQVLAYTGCDGLYIGRGALGRPWLFAQIHSYLATGSYPTPAFAEVAALILEHIALIHEHYGEYLGVRFARKHLKWYVQANPELLQSLTTHFSQFLHLETQAEQLAWLQQWLASLPTCA